MRFHSQNLNENKHGGVGSIWRHGRCWFGQYEKSRLRLEWTFFERNAFGLVLNLVDYDDDAIGGHLTFPYVGGVYWGLGNNRLRRLLERLTSRDKAPHSCGICRRCRMPEEHDVHSTGISTAPHEYEPLTYWSTNGRTIGVRWFEGTLWIDIWNDPMEYRGKDPWWWHISITPVDVIFGRTKHEERTLKTERVVVPMPEGGYPASVRIFESTWRRPRWPWPWKRMVRSEITPDTPIPFPGKGESEWDIGQDATHSMTCPADTPLKAAMALSESVIRSRIRYGAGWNYKPEKAVA